MKKVLIADDEIISRDGLCDLVRSLNGFVVADAVADGFSLWEKTVELEPDIILSDIRMPKRSGMWYLNQLEKAEYDLHVILISAYDDKEYLKAAMHNRFVFDYITKPFNTEKIAEILFQLRDYQEKWKRVNEKQRKCNQLLENMALNSLTSIYEKIDCLFKTEEFEIEMKEYAKLVTFKLFDKLCIQNDHNMALIDLETAYKEIDRALVKSDVIEAMKKFVKARKCMPETGMTALVGRAVQIIADEIGNPDLCLNSLSQSLGVTPNYLSYVFSRDMSQSFSTYLCNARMRRAKSLLSDLNLKVYDVATSAGFRDAAYFDRVFKENTGMSPLQYRRSLIHFDMKDDL